MMNAIFRNSSILVFLLVVGCAAHRQPRIAGRWQVAGTDNVVTLAKGGSAKFTSHGNTVNGRYRMIAPDMLILTLPGTIAQSGGRTITYKVPLAGHEDRSFKFFADTDVNTSPTAK